MSETLDIIKSKWNDILDFMKEEYEITDVSFGVWLAPLKVYTVEDNIVYIPVEDKRVASYMNKKFYKYFVTVISELMGEKYDVKFILQENANQDGLKNIIEENTINNNSVLLRIEEANLNPKYTFDTFVVGGSNNFAHAYALKIAEAPGEISNPLFLYGGPGLGKTHLMQSIAHYIIEHNADAKVRYVTSEDFTNELINVIRNENQNAVIEFRNKYRNIDVLLIDDIQFIIGKDRSQEEFFHTFNALYENNKQIVISSDKPPRDMTTLEERLKSRFEFGLPVDISSPEYETRMAILRRKAELQDYEVNDEVLQYIATNIVSNIRELEGALNRIISYSRISSQTMDLNLAKDILKDFISPDSHQEITSKLIIQMVADHFNISVNDLSSKRKTKNIAFPRQIAMYLCKNLTDDSLTSIGSLLGDRDHSTVIHGVKTIEDSIEKDESTKNTVEVLKKKISTP